MQIWNLILLGKFIGVPVGNKKNLHLKANLDYIYYGSLC